MAEGREDQGRIKVHLRDHTGNKSRQARVSTGARVQDLLSAIVTQLELPATDPTGRPVTYHLVHRGQQMQGDATLANADVQEGAELSIVPEMTAGAEV